MCVLKRRCRRQVQPPNLNVRHSNTPTPFIRDPSTIATFRQQSSIYPLLQPEGLHGASEASPGAPSSSLQTTMRGVEPLQLRPDAGPRLSWVRKFTIDSKHSPKGCQGLTIRTDSSVGHYAGRPPPQCRLGLRCSGAARQCSCFATNRLTCMPHHTTLSSGHALLRYVFRSRQALTGMYRRCLSKVSLIVLTSSIQRWP